MGRPTREHPDVLVGASPRAILSTFRCVQALALVDNGTTAGVEHVQELFRVCVGHRLRLRPGADLAAVLEAVERSVEPPSVGEPNRLLQALDSPFGV